jgi:hypothetical protein
MNDRPAMLVDVVWPLLSVLEGNPDAPMREAIAWELQLADATDDATLRDAYADRLQAWGCAKREADVRREAAGIRAGECPPRRRYSPVLGVRYPPGVSNVGTEESPVYRANQDLAMELVEGVARGGVMVALENTRDHTGGYEWDFIPAPGATVEVEREGTQ